MPTEEYPEWLDKTETSMFGVLTLDDAKQLMAEVVELLEDSREIVVEVMYPDRSGSQGRRVLSIDRVVSFDPQPQLAQPWPHADPCQSSRFSLARFCLMTTLFLAMIGGGLTMFILWADRPYGIQTASAIVYTLAEVFLTFAATRGWRRFLFTCPAVEPHLPRLLLRHLGFLIVLFVLQTAALSSRSNLPDWWNAKDAKGRTPFDLILMLVCIGLGYTQAFSSRSILERSHREFFPS